MLVELAFEARIFDMYSEKEIKKMSLAYLIIDLNFVPCIGDTLVWGENFNLNNEKIPFKQWEVIKNYSFEVKERIVYANGDLVLNLFII